MISRNSWTQSCNFSKSMPFLSVLSVLSVCLSMTTATPLSQGDSWWKFVLCLLALVIREIDSFVIPSEDCFSQKLSMPGVASFLVQLNHDFYNLDQSIDIVVSRSLRPFVYFVHFFYILQNDLLVLYFSKQRRFQVIAVPILLAEKTSGKMEQNFK